MKGITFRIDESLKMKQFREAETSNTAAIDLMAGYAIDEETRAAIPRETFLKIVDDLTILEFYQLYAEFVAAAIPNPSGRRS